VIELLASALRIGLQAKKRKVFAFRKLQPPIDFEGFPGSFPLVTMQYTSRAVIFGHVLAPWIWVVH
jgi:hypothetical protein